MKYKKISLQDMVDNKLEVMDLAASILALNNKLSLRVFSLLEKDSIVKSVKGENIGTLVYS